MVLRGAEASLSVGCELKRAVVLSDTLLVVTNDTSLEAGRKIDGDRSEPKTLGGAALIASAGGQGMHQGAYPKYTYFDTPSRRDAVCRFRATSEIQLSYPK